MPRVAKIHDEEQAGVQESRRRRIARAIQAGRWVREVSQAELADALTQATGQRWSVNMVSKVEKGAKIVPAETLVAIAEILDLDLDFLAYGPGGRTARSRSTARYLDPASDLLIHAVVPDLPQPAAAAPPEPALAA